MEQKYKIFLRSHQFVFDRHAEWRQGAHVTVNVLNKKLLKSLLKYLKDELKPKIILVEDPKGLKKFNKYLKQVKAAGGLVFNPKGELLLIKRNGLWDLPKGKLEDGEDSAEGAMREVEEECSVSGLRIVKDFMTSYHVYKEDKWILKPTDWYLMEASDWENAKPQLEENIVDIKWVKPEDIHLEDLDTYLSIKDVLARL
ncbi:MAG: NUDIX domain-containing protein [Bacteroidia bacterium]|nr:NUDIX domain-containing protein [Bacteroidia bacterium]